MVIWPRSSTDTRWADLEDQPRVLLDDEDRGAFAASLLSIDIASRIEVAREITTLVDKGELRMPAARLLESHGARAQGTTASCNVRACR